jgi:hypothetical protein
VGVVERVGLAETRRQHRGLIRTSGSCVKYRSCHAAIDVGKSDASMCLTQARIA